MYIGNVEQDFRSLICVVSGKTALNGLNSTSSTRASFSKTNPNPANGGDGIIPVDLVGSISRLPLGALASDSLFCCEDPLSNGNSYFSSSSMQMSIYDRGNSSPTKDGASYTFCSGVAGDILQMVDANHSVGGFFRTDRIAGTKNYTTSRGGSVFSVGGKVKGSPLTWSMTSFPQSSSPVLKGSLLACKAMLVRNFSEQAFSGADTSVRSQGDELQLVIATSTTFLNPNGSLTIGGEISPSGYGEGYSSVDRYRISGKPLVKYNSDIPLEDVVPAPLTFRQS